METTAIKLEKLVINLEDTSKDRNKETAIAHINWNGEFSAKAFRKVIQEKVTAWVKRVECKHTINRGSKLIVNVDFLGLQFKSQPIYFGGAVDTDKFKAERQLKEQLTFFVDDVKVSIEG